MGFGREKFILLLVMAGPLACSAKLGVFSKRGGGDATTPAPSEPGPPGPVAPQPSPASAAKSGPTATVVAAVLGPETTPGAATLIGGSVTAGDLTLDRVEVSMATGSGCLNDARKAFDASCPHWLPATTTNVSTWRLTIPDASFSERTYAVSVRAIAAGEIAQTPPARATFSWDATAPVVTSLALAGGATSVTARDVAVTLTATETGSQVTAVRLFETLGSCAEALPDYDWQTYRGDGQSFTLSFFSGKKRVCAQVRDAAGNVSSLSSGGAGTLGVDKAVIDFTQSAPPRFTALQVTSTGGANVAAGQPLTFSYAVASGLGLRAQPIRAVEYTTDGVNWEPYPSAQTDAATFGSTTAGATTFAGAFQGVAPSAGPLRFRLQVQDVNGAISVATTTAFNTGAWQAFAGTFNENGCSPATANAAILSRTADSTNAAVVWSRLTGDAYFVDYLLGIVRLSRRDGRVTCLVPRGLGVFAAHTLVRTRLREGPDGKIYFLAGGMYRLDPTEAAPTPRPYITGGTQVADGIDAGDLLIGSDMSPFTFDNAGNLYAVVADGVNDLSKYLIRVSRNGDAAGTVTILAGNGSSGAPAVNGSTPTNQPLPSVILHFWSLETSGDGSVIYFGNHASGWKIVAAKLYASALTTGTTTMINLWRRTDDPDGQPFYFQRNDGIYKFASAGAVDNGEALTLLVGSGGAADCHLDGKAPTAACPFGLAGLGVDPDGNLYFSEGSRHNAYGRHIRLRIVRGGSVETLAGVDGLGASLEHRLLLDASALGAMTLSPAGHVIVASAGSSHILQIDRTSGGVARIAGNGNPTGNPTAGASAVSQPLGPPYVGGNLYSLGVDPSTSQVYFIAAHRFYVIDGDGDLQVLGSPGGSPWYAIPTSGTLASVNSPLFVNMGTTGLTFDSSGNLYAFGGYNDGSSAAAPRVMKVRVSDGLLTNMAGARTGAAGATSNTLSADGATAATSTLRCDSSGSWPGGTGCYTTTPLYEGGKLYFSEFDRIRVLNTTDGTALLTTLADGDGTPVTDLSPPSETRGARKFALAGSRLYYERNRSFYCRWLGTAASMPADCQNEALAIPAVLGTGPYSTPSSSLVYEPSTKLLFIRLDLGQIVTYQVP